MATPTEREALEILNALAEEKPLSPKQEKLITDNAEQKVLEAFKSPDSLTKQMYTAAAAGNLLQREMYKDMAEQAAQLAAAKPTAGGPRRVRGSSGSYVETTPYAKPVPKATKVEDWSLSYAGERLTDALAGFQEAYYQFLLAQRDAHHAIDQELAKDPQNEALRENLTQHLQQGDIMTFISNLVTSPDTAPGLKTMLTPHLQRLEQRHQQLQIQFGKVNQCAAQPEQIQQARATAAQRVAAEEETARAAPQPTPEK